MIKSFAELKQEQLAICLAYEANTRASLEVAERHWALIHQLVALVPDDDGSVSIDSMSPNVHLSGSKQTLVEALKILRGEDWVPDQRPGEEPAERFSTAFRKDEDKIWLYFSSKVCKLVQVGTKTVEQPVFEVVCE